MNINAHRIKDINIYLNRMQKSVLDKMFFMDKIFEPISTVIDFGCANGELIKALGSLFGEYRYIGYDISESMIDSARGNVPAAEFYSEWDNISAEPKNSLLNISSVLHEVYSYCTEEEVCLFLSRVFDSGFKYIAIRDMMFSEKEKTYVDSAALKAVESNMKYKSKLADYEDVWGPIATEHSLLHYLLKYKYDQNWKREVRENYVPLTIEQFLRLIPKKYEITYIDHFTLPYVAWQIKNDFGIELTRPTYIKLILKRID